MTEETTAAPAEQLLYQDYKRMKDVYEIVHQTVKDSQDRFKPLAQAKEEAKEAAARVSDEKKQWAGSDDAKGLLKAERKARKDMKEAKASLDEAVVVKVARGDQPSLFDEGRPLEITLTAKYKRSLEGSTVSADAASLVE